MGGISHENTGGRLLFHSKGEYLDKVGKHNKKELRLEKYDILCQAVVSDPLQNIGFVVSFIAIPSNPKLFLLLSFSFRSYFWEN